MTAPTLREVHRGRAADELVLVDSDGRAILLRGDGLTEDERIRMRERAFAVLSGGVMTPEQKNGSDAPLAAAHPSLAGQPMPLASHKSAEDVALVSVHQRFTETQGRPGAARAGGDPYVAARPVISQDATRNRAQRYLRD